MDGAPTAGERDQHAIVELIHRYNRLLDAGRYDEWADCFTAAGVFHGAFGQWVVHRDIDDFAALARERAATIAPNTRHFVTNVLVEVDGSAAHANSFLMVTTCAPNAHPQIALTGAYDDELVEEDGSWKFAHRRVHIDGRTSGSVTP
jgi:3-phenylpropionate/cinnamic acid dioxygenase small subunit